MRNDNYYARLAAQAERHNPQELQEEIARHVKEFLARGGEIKQLPWGASKYGPSTNKLPMPKEHL